MLDQLDYLVGATADHHHKLRESSRRGLDVG